MCLALPTISETDMPTETFISVLVARSGVRIVSRTRHTTEMYWRQSKRRGFI